MSEPLEAGGGREIAVIGMAGRFPKARNLGQLWRNLREGVEAVTFFTDAELARSGVPPERLRDARYVKAASLLDGVDEFDAGFFGYSAREAEIMDPQQRFFLEHAWQALEDAGYSPNGYGGLIGVYAGVAWNTYLLSNLTTHPELFDGGGGFQVFITNDKDFMPTKVSYKLNLKGPSLIVQTSCSTSLVAVHLACLSLLSFECDMALAGGVTVKVPQLAGYYALDGGLASPDGHCRAFDARAAGTIFGSGVGVVVLKRLDEAIADGDSIRAVIRGSAINNDGSLKVSYTAPSVEGQAEVVASAQALAGISPETVRYIEAHGTGTSLGDPIEVTALTKVFRDSTDRRGFCALGSIKTNFGHLDAAAGIAGFIKTVLALEHREIPPSLHFEQPNPAIDFASSPFYVNTALTAWEAGEAPRRAGVSSFGVGGTNAHVVLEEAPPAEPPAASRPWQVLLLSARSEPALEEATTNLLAWLREADDGQLADAAYTLRVGRTVFRHRRAVVCRDREDAVAVLESLDPARVLTAADVEDPRDRPVVFLFPGEGAEHVDMARDLYAAEEVFRWEVDRCAELLRPQLGLDLRRILYPAAGQRQEAECGLARAALSQPALFAVEHAMARLWMSWGVRPQAMIGHGVGEYAAACLAGVLALEDALDLVAAHGRLLDLQPPGVTAGVPEPAIDPALAPLAAEVARVALRAPEIPFVSSVTGTWITAEEATDPGYWIRHLRQPVRFADGISELLRDERRILLEVGPGRALATLAERHPERTTQTVVASLAAPQEGVPDLAALLAALGRLWLAGLRLDWSGFHAGERRRRVPLPTYPFERQRYWIAAQPSAAAPADGRAAAPAKRPDLANWFYVPSWKPSLPASPAPEEAPRSWLVLAAPDGPSAALARRLARAGREVIAVEPADLAGSGAGFRRLGETAYAVDPRHPDAFEGLLAELWSQERLPEAVLHAWDLGRGAPAADGAGFEAAQERGFYTLLALAGAMDELGWAPRELAVVASGLFSLNACEALQPEKATMLGLCKVLPQEVPGLACRAIDAALPAEGAERALDRLVGQLADELEASTADERVAYRAGQRWVPVAEPLRLPAPGIGPDGAPLPFRHQGVYLLTGGLAGNGFALASYLARAASARLVLLEDPPFPPEAEWPAVQAAGGEPARRIGRVRELRELGAEVLAVEAGPGDVEAVRGAVARAAACWDPLHGVIHAASTQGERSFRLIRELDRESSGWHFRTKVHALFALESALAEYEPELCILLSSLAAELGGMAYAAYTAANCFLDAFAQDRARRGGPAWRSLGWDVWELEGEPEQITVARDDLAGLAMSPREGEEAFCRAVAAPGLDRVLVSTADLASRLEQTRRRIGALQERARVAMVPAFRHPRPALQTPYAAPKTDLEQHIAEVWKRSLGFDEIGVHDNFFELGGDSFVAVQVMSRLQDELRIELPVAKLYQGLTIHSLASLLAQDEVTLAEQRAAYLEERRESMGRRRELLERRRSSKKSEAH